MYEQEENINNLVGQTIILVEGNDGCTDVRLHLKSGKVLKISAYGDCCSSSWFEHITLPAAVPCTITSVPEIIFMQEFETGNEYECLKQYSYKIMTDKGVLELEMRNSSNGYYGGYVDYYIE